MKKRLFAVFLIIYIHFYLYIYRYLYIIINKGKMSSPEDERIKRGVIL